MNVDHSDLKTNAKFVCIRDCLRNASDQSSVCIFTDLLSFIVLIIYFVLLFKQQVEEVDSFVSEIYLKWSCLPEEETGQESKNNDSQGKPVSSVNNKYSLDDLKVYSTDFSCHSVSVNDCISNETNISHLHQNLRKREQDFSKNGRGCPFDVSSLGSSNKDLLQASLLNDSQTEESQKLQILAMKFNSDVASIWSSSSCNNNNNSLSASDSCWAPGSLPSVSLLNLEESGIASSLSNIWSFSPGTSSSSHEVSSSSSSHLSSPLNHSSTGNNTSLKNHTEDSLFVQVSSSRASNTGSGQSGSRASSSNENHVNNTSSKRGSSDVCNDNLLTSLQTHFQPIRQDYYERGPNNVTDTKQSGLVPCSGKCPNHLRNRCQERNRQRNCHDRSTSVSREELSLIVGPFNEEEGEEEETPEAQSCDKEDKSEDKEGREGSSAETPAVDDYEAICSILNDVLRNQSPTSSQQHESLLKQSSDGDVLAFSKVYHDKCSSDSHLPPSEVLFDASSSYLFDNEVETSYQSYAEVDHLSGSDDTAAYESYASEEAYLGNWDPTSYAFEGGLQTTQMQNWSVGSDARDTSLSPQPAPYFAFQAKSGECFEGCCRKNSCLTLYVS